MSDEPEECGTCHGMGIVSEEHDGGYHPVHCPKGCPDPVERARKAEAALRDTARMLSNRTRALQRVEALAGELEAADNGSADKDYRLGRFVVSEIRAIVADEEAESDA